MTRECVPPDFDKERRAFLIQQTEAFANWYNANIHEVIWRSLPHPIQAIQRPRGRITELRKALAECHDLTPFLPLLKRILIVRRREISAQQEHLKSKTNDPGVRESLDQPVQAFVAVMDQPWFDYYQPFPLPRLSDYLTLQEIQNSCGKDQALGDREFDEKFGLLFAPSLILPDLHYYRWRCALRDAPLAVAFLDIDDFKSFNDEYSETKVDKYMLPRFMAEIESHVFNHGFAYRLGGDEYFIILPNMSCEWSIDFLKALQARLRNAKYDPIKKESSVSIGLCHIDDDCFLADVEIQAKANDAKKFAKEQGKNRIAKFKDSSFRAGDFCIV